MGSAGSSGWGAHRSPSRVGFCAGRTSPSSGQDSAGDRWTGGLVRGNSPAALPGHRAPRSPNGEAVLGSRVLVSGADGGEARRDPARGQCAGRGGTRASAPPPRRRRLQAAVLTGPLPGCHEEDARLGQRPGSAHEPPPSSSRRRRSSESSSSDGSGAEPAWGSEALCETPAPPSRHRPQRPHCHLRGPLGLGKPPRRGQTW